MRADRRDTTTPRTPRPADRWWLTGLLTQRSVQITVVAWVVAQLGVVILVHGHLPFHRPSLNHTPVDTQLLSPNLAILEELGVIALVFALTRRRIIPDVGARAPDRPVALRETWWIILYGIAGLLGGIIVARLLGIHPISFHLDGTLYGTDDVLHPGEVAVWAGYNFLVFAVAPYLYYRRRYTSTQLNLRSTDRRNDLLVIGVILVVESIVDYVSLNSQLLSLSPKQLATGMPLTFVVYFLGTVLPTMVYIQCLLIPRFRRLTGSTATTVILGGIAYTLVHCTDGWMAFNTTSATVLSVVFLFFQYLGPGMVKAAMTLRTGNAWVHVWAYHAITPHVLDDTPFIVKIFHL
jgi:hypothetical protein